MGDLEWVFHQQEGVMFFKPFDQPAAVFSAGEMLRARLRQAFSKRTLLGSVECRA